MELINHDVLERGGSLLVDERDVVPVDHLVKLVRRVAKDEAIRLVVDAAKRCVHHLQQTHLVQVFENRFAGVLLSSQLHFAIIHLLEPWLVTAVQFSVFQPIGIRIFHQCGRRFRRCPVGNLRQETVNTCFPLYEHRRFQTVCIAVGQKRLRILQAALANGFQFLEQMPLVIDKESRIAGALVDELLVLQILLIEDVAAELGHLSLYLPILILAIKVVLYVCQHRIVNPVALMHPLYHLVHSISKSFILIQVDTQVGCEVQFASQVAYDALEEGVDRLNTEVVVIM